MIRRVIRLIVCHVLLDICTFLYKLGHGVFILMLHILPEDIKNKYFEEA